MLQPADFFSTVCYFSGCNARQGRPGRTCKIESNHGIEKGQTPFARTEVNKRSNHNRSCEILLIYDPWSLTPKSPAGQGFVTGSGIGNWVGRLNHTHA